MNRERRDTVAAVTTDLRRVVLALVVLALGISGVCMCQRDVATRVRLPGQAPPLEGSLAPGEPEKPRRVELHQLPQLHDRADARGPYYAPAGVPNSEPGESRFLRFRRASWDRRCVLSG